MSKSPAFQFYPADWLADAEVSLMTLEEEGAYIRALCYCWREGSIPSDPTRLCRLLKGGSTVVARVVQERFELCADDGSKMVHPRLENERIKQEKWSQKSVEGGKKSAEAREIKRLRKLSKGGSNLVEPNVNRPVEPNVNSSSSSSSSITTVGEGHREVIKFFSEGWQRRYGKQYPFQRGRDGKAVKETIAACGGSIEETKAAMTRFLADTDQFLHGHRLALLSSMISKYVTDAPKKVVNGNSRPAPPEILHEAIISKI